MRVPIPAAIILICLFCLPASSPAASFDAITLKDVSGLQYLASPIPAAPDSTNQLTPGARFAFITGEGRYGVSEVVESTKDLVIKWKTFRADGAVYSSGQSLRIRPTWFADVDRGVETDGTQGDLWWEHGKTAMDRSLSPVNGAKVTRMGATSAAPVSLQTVTLAMLKATTLTGGDLNGSTGKGNQLDTGAIIFYRTDEERYGAFEVLEAGMNMTIAWVTFAPDGTVFGSGKRFVVEAGYPVDLDKGTLTMSEGSPTDFMWQVNGPDWRLNPRSGALFAKYR